MTTPPHSPPGALFPPIDELARKLAAGLPEAMGSLRRDLESHIKAVLQGQLSRLDLASRADFSVQAKVLERARTKVEQLEARVVALERRLGELEVHRGLPGQAPPTAR